MKTENYPIVKVLLPYVLGILIAYFGDFPDTVCRLLLWSSVAAVLLTAALTFVRAYRWRVIQTIVMNLAFVTMGISLTNWHFHPHKSPVSIESEKDWIVRVASDPVPRERSVKVEAEVVQTSENKPVNEKVLFFLQQSGEAAKLCYGDLLLVHATLSPIEPPHNPDAFDNQLYLRRRGIHYSGFVRDDAWERVGNHPANRLKLLAQNARNRLTDIYISTGMSGNELDVLKAILLGDDDTLDPDLRASYSSAGVSHILCVSGMHVGVIFMIINFLLKPWIYLATPAS